MGEQVAHALVLGAFGLVVTLVGRWGREHAVALVPGHLEVFDREKRIRTLERGGFACYVGGLVLLGAAVLALV